MNKLAEQLNATLKSLEATPNWLSVIRQNYLNQFLNSKFDSENWKYHNTKNLLNNLNSIATFKNNDISKGIVNKLIPEATKDFSLVFVDGFFYEELSTIGKLPNGVILSSISQAISSYPSLLQTELQKQTNTFLEPFSSMNFALFTDGYFLYVPEDIQIEHLIHVLFLSTSKIQDKICDMFNCLITKKASKVTLIEKYVGLDDATYFNNTFTRISAEASTSITYYKLQQESQNASHIANLQISQQQNSHVKTNHLTMGASLSRESLYVALNENSNISSKGISLINNKQTSDYHTRIEHLNSNSTSNVLYKTVLSNEATGIFSGRVRVDKNASNSTTHLTNNNLLLTETATINTSPELEIYTDNVVCTHGATCGQLDKDALFYLRTRGIPENEAKKLLIEGFIQEILDVFPEYIKSSVEN